MFHFTAVGFERLRCFKLHALRVRISISYGNTPGGGSKGNEIAGKCVRTSIIVATAMSGGEAPRSHFRKEVNMGSTRVVEARDEGIGIFQTINRGRYHT